MDDPTVGCQHHQRRLREKAQISDVTASGLSRVRDLIEVDASTGDALTPGVLDP
jgi:hypothetical protein